MMDIWLSILLIAMFVLGYFKGRDDGHNKIIDQARKLAAKQRVSK